MATQVAAEERVDARPGVGRDLTVVPGVHSHDLGENGQGPRIGRAVEKAVAPRARGNPKPLALKPEIRRLCSELQDRLAAAEQGGRERPPARRWR